MRMFYRTSVACRKTNLQGMRDVAEDAWETLAEDSDEACSISCAIAQASATYFAVAATQRSSTFSELFQGQRAGRQEAS